ncbi:MAG: M23 family metallopeptidase [Tannerellaceae bacterium]
MLKKYTFLLALGCSILSGSAQQFCNPFEFPILLSGNFGELRNNHFHSGIDFKTQGAEGKPVHAVQDGYVSRISVSPWGYGNALYLTHPDGTTTVYGHLQKYADKIAAYVKEQQYALQGFAVDLTPTPEQLPVKQGEVVALSGNTGSSGGPHLHFEVRDTQTQEALDPLNYYQERIADTRAPKIQGVMVYPIEGKGVVNGSSRKLALKTIAAKNGRQTLTGKIEAWGEIGFAIKAYDTMDGTSNIYGVKEITLSVDSQVIFHSNLDRYAFSETRYLNSFTDYEEWREHRSFYMKSFVEPGNRLRFIEAKNRGILTLDQPGSYHLNYRLMDAFGNISQLSIWVEAKKQSIPQPDTIGTEHFYWNSDNRFGAKGIRFTVPRGILYNDFNFRYQVKEDSMALAATHILHNRPVPLHNLCPLSLRLQTDTLKNKSQYGIVGINGGRATWIGGTYRNGWIDGEIKELGSYTIRQDVTPPVITPLNPAGWMRSRTFSFRLGDDLSGVQSYHGEVDGNFILFEMNNRSVITCRFDKEHIVRGKHTLKLKVKDGCGNQSIYTYSFVW